MKGAVPPTTGYGPKDRSPYQIPRGSEPTKPSPEGADV